MSTSGTLLGRDCVIKKGSTPALVVGQGDFTMTMNGAPVEVTNKSSGGFTEYHDGATTSQQVIFSGTIIYNDTDDFDTIRGDAFTGTQDDYTIEFSDNGETYTAKFVPTGLSDNLALDGSAVQTTISFNSSGVVTRTGITTPS